jgi:hypothetical protein
MNRFGLRCVAVLLFVPAGRAEAPYFLFAGEGKSFWASGGVPDDAFKLQSKVVEGGIRLTGRSGAQSRLRENSEQQPDPCT